MWWKLFFLIENDLILNCNCETITYQSCKVKKVWKTTNHVPVFFHYTYTKPSSYSSNHYSASFTYGVIAVSITYFVLCNPKHLLNTAVFCDNNITHWRKTQLNLSNKTIKNTYKESSVFLPHINTYTYILLKPHPLVCLLKYLILGVRDKILSLPVFCEFILHFPW